MRRKERGGGIGVGCLVGKSEEEWVGEVMGSLLDVFISGDPETHDR